MRQMHLLAGVFTRGTNYVRIGSPMHCKTDRSLSRTSSDLGECRPVSFVIVMKYVRPVERRLHDILSVCN